MGKVKKLPPSMERAKETRKTVDKFEKIVPELQEANKKLIDNLKLMHSAIEKFRLDICGLKTQAAAYYDSIPHDNKDQHQDYKILVEVDKKSEKLLEEVDRIVDDAISNEPTSSSNEVC